MPLADELAARLTGEASLPLMTLDSGATVGLDAAARWVFTSDTGAPTTFSSEAALAFAEVLEQKRDTFEDALAAGARGAGLAEREVVVAFPAVDLVRAVLAKEFPYMTRLALLWILPSELRELRPDIVRISESTRTPAPIRDLAKRLIVPIGYE